MDRSKWTGVTVVLVAGWLLTGCAGEPEITESGGLEIGGAAPAPAPGEPLKVAVAPFDDTVIGRRCSGTHRSFWGGRSAFAIPVVGRHPGEVAALMLIDALQDEKGWSTWLDTSGITPPQGGADVLITGEVVQCDAVAQSRLAATRVTATAQIVLHARNAADGSLVRNEMRAVTNRWIVWFEPEETEIPLSAVLRQIVTKFVSGTTVKRRVLRLLSEE